MRASSTPPPTNGHNNKTSSAEMKQSQQQQPAVEIMNIYIKNIYILSIIHIYLQLKSCVTTRLTFNSLNRCLYYCRHFLTFKDLLHFFSLQVLWSSVIHQYNIWPTDTPPGQNPPPCCERIDLRRV